MMHRYLSSYVALAAVAVGLSFGVAGCNEDGSNVLCSGAVYDPVTGKRSDYGLTAVGKRVNTVLDATTAFVKASTEIDTGMLAECTAMATELGIPAAQLEPAAPPPGQMLAPGARTKAACERVAQQIDTTLRANLKLNAYLNVVYKPAVCTVSASARLSCLQTCETMTVTETQLMCKPGKIYYPTCEGTCGGSCEGSCQLGCTGSCSAECSGSCDVVTSAKCEGKCYVALDAAGKCNGTCSVAPAADGTCAGECEGALTATGVCNGTCRTNVKGACSGTCRGGCSGTCKGGCSATCTGGCRGSCTAGGVMPPVCEEVQVMREEKTCETTCNAKASCEAMCTEPELSVEIAASAIVDPVKVTAVVNTLKAHYGKILKLSQRAAIVAGSTVSAYATALNGLATSVGEAGVQAGACVASAASYAANALSAVQVSASVSISVSASVSASGTAGGMAAAGG
ncbi:MAG: hypothetical protein SF187_07765 [Deltaproteobacteria bacterium]|nr:hypothetical protein [Deltaproteobacteria bacterium]